MVSLVRVGEDGGFLADACTQLSEYIERDVQLRNLIRRETAYPKITVAVSILVILLTNAVIQALAPDGIRMPVPWLVWAVTAIAAVGSFLFVRLALPVPSVRRSFDDFVLRLPGIGGMVMGFAMAKFGRDFGALYKGGVPLPKAVVLAADACGNEGVRARVRPVANKLEEGQGITETFAASGAFSQLVLDMTRTGEATGNMDEMLTRVADYYEDEGQTKAQMAARIVGVVCLIAVAVYVLYVVLSFFMSYASHVFSAGAG
jgi:type II secretory pathway component PulF